MTRIISILLILCTIFSLNAAPAQGSQEALEITSYKISVRLPDSCDRVEVSAALSIAGRPSQTEGNLVLALCRDFKGVRAVNIKVFDSGGEPLPFTVEGDRLKIGLTQLPGKDSAPVITYDLVKSEDFGKDPYSAFAFETSEKLCHINASITRTDNWYPRLEGTLKDRIPPFELSIDSPSRFEVMASGKLRSVTEKEGRVLSQWVNYRDITDRSLYFFAQACRKVVKSFPDGFNIIFYIPSEAKEENIAALAGVIHRSYAFFESAYGSAPEREYKIMAFPYGYSGLYNSMTVPVQLFTAPISLNEIGFPLRSVIHEVSHTWWGNIVSFDPEKDYWLFEGWAKFSEIIGLEPALGIDAGRESFRRLKLFSLPYLEHLPAISNAGDSDSRILQRISAYYGGALFLRNLELIMGKEKFSEGVKDFVITCRGKCAGTEDLKEAMQRHSLAGLGDFFEDYLQKQGFAKFSVTRVATKVKKKEYITAFLVSNDGDKDINTDISIENGAKKPVGRLILQKGESKIVTVRKRESEAGLESIKIDPGGMFPVVEAHLRGAGGILVNLGDQYKFQEIIGDSLLEKAGIKENMILLSIDGESLTGKDVCTVNSLLLQPRGTTLTLLIREGESEAREVKLQY